MDFTLSEENQLFQETLRTYALKELAPKMAQWKTEPFPKEMVIELGDLGVLGLRVPVEYGGSEGSYVSMGVAAEELSRGDFNVGYYIQLSSIAAGLLDNADESIKEKWLPAIASGEAVVAFALTEPGVGSDAANLSCSAHREGDEWVLNGEKASITFGGSAEGCVVFARTGGPGARGISKIFVPLDAPGVTRSVYSSAGGHLCQRGSLFFDDVSVPLDHQIGEEGTGFIGAMEAFDFNRATIALASIGTATQCLDETVRLHEGAQDLRKAIGHQGSRRIPDCRTLRLTSRHPPARLRGLGPSRRRSSPHHAGVHGEVAWPQTIGRSDSRVHAPSRLVGLRNRPPVCATTQRCHWPRGR